MMMPSASASSIVNARFASESGWMMMLSDIEPRLALNLRFTASASATSQGTEDDAGLRTENRPLLPPLQIVESLLFPLSLPLPPAAEKPLNVDERTIFRGGSVLGPVGGTLAAS